MDSKMRETILGIVAGMRGEKRAANIGRVLSRGLRRLGRSSGRFLSGDLGGWKTLSGSTAKRLSGAQDRLVRELQRLNAQKDILTGIGRANPNNWSFSQADGWGALGKSQKKVIAGAMSAHRPDTMARWGKLLDREIAALEKRRAARHDALLRVTKLLPGERAAVHDARVFAAQRLALGGIAAGGAGYGLHKLLGGKGDGEKKAAEAAYAEGFRKAAETLGVTPGALVKRAGIASAVRGLVRSAGKAKGGAGLRKALEGGGIVLSPARPTKELVHEALKGLRGPRSYGWPLPAYPFRDGRDAGLSDLLLRFKSLGTASTPGGRLTNSEAIQLLRRLNGNTAVVGPQAAAALSKSVVPPRPVGVDLAGMKLPSKKASAEGVRKAARQLLRQAGYLK